ncbi:MAG: cupredoxin domain-containing protein [Acidimicrobiia bacterium]
MGKILPLTVTVMLVLAGCGTDDDDNANGTATARSETSGASSAPSGSGSGPAVSADEPPVTLEGATTAHGNGDASSGELELEVDDNYFAPTFVKAAAGTEVEIHLANEGERSHTFTSSALNVDETLEPGDERDVTVTLPAGDGVEFHCRFHEGGGMQGAFYATDGATIAG